MRKRVAEQKGHPIIPAYLDDFLTRRARTRQEGRRGETFIHLGHWDQPATATFEGNAIERAQGRLNELLVELAAIPDGAAVLDVGCGVGGTLGSIAARHKGMKLVGLNLDPRQLEIARHEISAGPTNTLDWIVGDACALPFEPGSFDRVLAVECAFHFPSRRLFFQQAHRVLRTGGLLVMSDFVASDELRSLASSNTWPAFAVRALLNEGLGPWPDPWCEEGTPQQLAAAAGFELVTARDATAETLPSYASFLSHGGKGGAPAIDLDQHAGADRSVATLAWLQNSGLFRMEYLAFRKP